MEYAHIIITHIVIYNEYEFLNMTNKIFQSDFYIFVLIIYLITFTVLVTLKEFRFATLP